MPVITVHVRECFVKESEREDERILRSLSLFSQSEIENQREKT